MSRWEVLFLFLLSVFLAFFFLYAYEKMVLCEHRGGTYSYGECYEDRNP